MGKRGWNIRAVQTLLLLITFCLLLPALASSVSSASTRPGEASPVAHTSSTQQRATKSLPPKHQRNVKTAVSTKRSHSAKSRTLKSVALSGRRYGQRKVALAKKTTPTVHLDSIELPFVADDELAAVSGSAFSPETAPFSVQVNDERLPYRINSAFVLPAERLTFAGGAAEGNNAYLIEATPEVTQTGLDQWSWQAPRKAGLYPVTIHSPSEGAPIILNVFVMLPFAQLERGYLNGYHIGNYPRFPLKLLPLYHSPQGFIEVTRVNEDVLVSPHFRLRQFLCKQDDEYPKYLVLDSRLLLVLESILQKANTAGYHAQTFEIMSGYRTPYYNRAIGNSTTYSRHTLGDAADIFIDAHPRDGNMDDLNRDGVVNFQDTKVLYNLVNQMYESRAQRFWPSGFMAEPRVQQFLLDSSTDESPLQRLLTGGLARYRETNAHGPFVHVDVRGVYTRWGQ
ncbi:MAG: hypothetical protein HY268_12350 [Deltaproteobacteria bacterium]|nr:hypothetical protein [Deltaproteobacteria bacterium]